MGLMTNSNVHFLANISSVSIDCILNYECWHSLDSFITTTVAKVFRTSVLKNLPFPAKFVSRSWVSMSFICGLSVNSNDCARLIRNFLASNMILGNLELFVALPISRLGSCLREKYANFYLLQQHQHSCVLSSCFFSNDAKSKFDFQCLLWEASTSRLWSMGIAGTGNSLGLVIRRVICQAQRLLPQSFFLISVQSTPEFFGH